LKLPLLLLPVLFVLCIFPLAAQEYPTETEAQEQELSPDATPEAEQDIADDHEQAELPGDDSIYVISAFEFDIKGRTRPFILIHIGEFKLGETLEGKAELDQYIHDKTQILFNQRLLKDNVEITYSVGEQSENGSYPVTLTIKVEDSWNIVALPRPYYKSDKGLDLSIRARDYNFLGTMNALRVNMGYKHDADGYNSFQFEVLSNVPFSALGYHWNVKFDNSFNYRQEKEEPFFYQNVTGLSVEIPFYKTTFTFGFEEATILNEENPDVYKESIYKKTTPIGHYPDFQEGMYMSSRLSASWRIPTGFSVSRYGELTYTPAISATFNHELPGWDLHDIRYGPTMGFGHALYFEKVDWHGNYRDGISASIGNAYGYNFHSLSKEDENPLSISLAFSGSGHFIISKFFAFSSRIMYRHWFIYNDPKYYDYASDAMRGIADDEINADYMLSLNTDFPFRVLIFSPSEWFKNRKLRLFDFELHLSPVIDIALYNDPSTSTFFHPKNIAASGGLEAIVFPGFMRNFIIRFGYAANLRNLLATREIPDGNNREFYLIGGHFY